MLQKAGSGVKGKVGARRGGQKPNLHRRGRGVRRGNQAVDISWENICEECFLPLIERVLFREKMEKVEVPPLPSPSEGCYWRWFRKNSFQNLERFVVRRQNFCNKILSHFLMTCRRTAFPFASIHPLNFL